MSYFCAVLLSITISVNLTCGASVGTTNTILTTTDFTETTGASMLPAPPTPMTNGVLGFCKLKGRTCIRSSQCCSKNCVEVNEMNPMFGMTCA